MTAVAERTATPMVELRDQLEARTAEFANALPSHIKPAHFQRATLTAIQQNPKLLDVDRRSLLNALMRCAGDGLLPDGRQAALVIYKSKDRGPIAQYLPMVAGIRKLVQQSGEISRFEQVVVYDGDEFAYELGDQPFIKHKPALTNRGLPVVVYSVAQWRDGTLSREVMTVDEIEKVRAASRAANDGPWVDWWEEMARKTVAKRHAKVLPMSNDAADVLARDDDFKPPSLALPSMPAIERRPRLAEQLDKLGPAHQPAEAALPRARRGRPRKGEATDDTAGQVPDDIPDMVPDGLPLDEGPLPNPMTTPPNADYLAGVKDALRGAAACLNRDIVDDPQRLADWQRGYSSQKQQR